MSNPTTTLPPGFRFHPTDEELISHYLRNRAASTPCPVSIIAEVDIYKFNPWDLPAKAMFGDREWYFFSPRDRKYPNGVRPNRAAASGYWKATGTDKPIQGGNEHIGVKKALVFYKGRPPKGIKTNWIMHEYRLAEAGNTNSYKPMKLRDHSMRLDDWVLCRIYKKSNNQSVPSLMDQEQEDSGTEDAYLPSLQNINQENCAFKLPKSSSISDLLEDYSALTHLFDTQPEPPVSDFNSILANPSLNHMFINGNNNYNNNNNNNTNTGVNGANYFEQSIMSPLKRQRTTGDYSSNQVDATHHYSFFNQQLLSNSPFGLH